MKTFSAHSPCRQALVSFALCGLVAAAWANPAPQAEALGRLEQQAAEAVGAGRWDAALSAMEAMRGLGVRLPESFSYYYAQALVQQGRHLDAHQALSSYIATAGHESRFIEPARALLARIEAPVSEQQAKLDATRRQAELLQEQADGVRRSERLIQSSIGSLGGAITSVAFTLTGERLLAGVGHQVALIDIAKGRVAGRLSTPGAVSAVAPNPLGLTWAVAHAKGGGSWRSTTGDIIPGLGLDSAATAVAAHPEGIALAYGLNDGTVRRVDTTTRLWSEWARLGKTPIAHLAYSPDGLWLAAATSAQPVAVHVGPVRSGAQARKLPWNSGVLADLAFTPDAKRLIAADASGRRLLSWTVGANNTAWSPWIEGVHLTPGTLAMDPRGRMVAIAHASLIEFYDLSKGSLRGRLYLPSSMKVTATAFDFDGNQLATGLADGTVHVWNVSGH